MSRDRKRTSERKGCTKATLEEARKGAAKLESTRLAVNSLRMPEPTLCLRQQKLYSSFVRSIYDNNSSQMEENFVDNLKKT